MISIAYFLQTLLFTEDFSWTSSFHPGISGDRHFGLIVGTFRLDYEYEIEYEYDFRISNQ